MREQRTKAQVKKNNKTKQKEKQKLQDNTHPLSTIPHCYIQLTFGIWCEPLSLHPLPPARHQPHPLTPSTQTII